MNTTIEIGGKVGVAVESTIRGIDELIGLLGDGDEAVVMEVMVQLPCLGAAAVGRLASALVAWGDARQQIPIVRALGVIGLSEPELVIQVLTPAWGVATDWQVRQAIALTLWNIAGAERMRRIDGSCGHDEARPEQSRRPARGRRPGATDIILTSPDI